METAIACLISFFAGMAVAVLLAAVAGHIGDPDDESEVNGPEFL
jgi:tyrosyl-tRNA synthetase